VKLTIGEGLRSGKLVLRIDAGGEELCGRAILSDLDLLISRGDRLGSSARTARARPTLINLALGKLAPDADACAWAGNVQPPTSTRCAKLSTPGKLSPRRSARLGMDRARRRRNARHELPRRFLFPRVAPTRRSHALGGERNRLLLARLFAAGRKSSWSTTTSIDPRSSSRSCARQPTYAGRAKRRARRRRLRSPPESMAHPASWRDAAGRGIAEVAHDVLAGRRRARSIPSLG